MIKSKNYIYYLIPLLPIIDLLTSLQTRYFSNIPSVGTIIKGIIILISCFYVLFKSMSKYKKVSVLYFLLILGYIILYFIFKPDLLNSNFIFNEFKYIIKISFMPVLFISLLNYFNEYGFNFNKFIKAMVITLIEYVILLFIPNSLGLSFNSYNYGLHGVVGWFYAANEVSVIMILLLPFMYFLFNKKYNFLISIPVLYTICSIGTKVSFLGTIIVTTLALIFLLIKDKCKINSYLIGAFFAFVCAILFGFVFKNTTIENTKQLAAQQEFTFIESTPINSNTTIQKPKFSDKLAETLEFLLSNRDEFFKQTRDIFYARYENGYYLFGMGFSNTERINNANINKLIEIDYLDLFYHTGTIGLIIILLPILWCIYLAIKHAVIASDRQHKINNCFVLLIILMILSVAAIAGHILFYPAVSIYLTFYLIIIFYLCGCFDKQKISNNKITFLALHLKNGGIETAIVNKANMLVDKYNVEIVCLYKTKDKPKYEINKNIKISYLMNDISNKEEFMDAIKNKKISSIIKEGLKSIKILYLKPKLIKKYILNTNSKIIISTRKEFSKILGVYKRKDIITIGEEHNYKLDDSNYVKSVINSNTKMDYFIPASMDLANFYENNMETNIKYIPNVINSPFIKNNLKKHKLMAIGRLSKEKGFIDLIPIVKELKKFDKNIVVDLYGDGPEKNNILNEINNNNLEKNIILKGNVEFDKLNDLRKNYSIMIVPSYTESFGLAILESMSFGIVPVIFDEPTGPKEFLNKNNSIIIENRDYKQMANKINQLMENEKLYKKISENTYETSLRYSIKEITPQYMDFIKNIIVKSNQKKVIFISSTGGHLTELLQLKGLFDNYNYHLITEKTKNNLSLKSEYKSKISYLVYGTKSHLSYLYIFPYNIIKSIYLFKKINPDIIITTGAHTCVPMCYIAKMHQRKIIYIETFANINTKTLTGRLIYPIADLFFVQWESMLKLYPNAIYEGWLF